MDEAAKAMAESLFEAIKAEGDGRSFYMMAARSTADDKAREVFGQLADEELGHQEFLKAQYRSILENGTIDSAAKLGRPRDLSEASPIFSAGLKSRIKEAHMEMSALAIGIQLELGAMNYYREAAGRASDPAIKAFFSELAEWESGHYNALLRQQEALKEDYWSAAGFSPF